MDCGYELDRCTSQYGSICWLGLEDEGPSSALGTNWKRVRVCCHSAWTSREGSKLEAEDR